MIGWNMILNLGLVLALPKKETKRNYQNGEQSNHPEHQCSPENINQAFIHFYFAFRFPVDHLGFLTVANLVLPVYYFGPRRIVQKLNKNSLNTFGSLHYLQDTLHLKAYESSETFIQSHRMHGDSKFLLQNGSKTQH